MVGTVAILCQKKFDQCRFLPDRAYRAESDELVIYQLVPLPLCLMS